MSHIWRRGCWVRLTSGEIAYVRRVNWEDEPITYDLRLPTGDDENGGFLYDTPTSRVKCYVEKRTIWVDVEEEVPTQ